jgi:hypothetical protein
VIFRGHPDIQAQRDRIGNPERATASRTPASTRLLHACGALLAGAVEQPLRDVLSGRVAAIQSDCIGGLDFQGPLAAAAGDAQHVPPNF